MERKDLPEDPVFADLRQQLTDEHKPVGLSQQMLVDDMAFCLWRAKRLAEQSAWVDLAVAAKMDKQIEGHMRGYRMSLSSLEMLRKIAAAQGKRSSGRPN